MSDIVSMIATYGILPVLAAAIIFVIVYLIKSQHKFNAKQQELNKHQQEANTAQENKLMEMFSTLLEINRNTAISHSKEEEEDNRQVDEFVNAQLQKLVDENSANRACCFLYHNGGRSVVGRSFQKMSITHEKVDLNTVPTMSSLQQVPRMMFPILNQQIAEQGYYYIEDINDIKELDAVTYQAYYARGVKAVFIQGIKATNGSILGFISAEYISNSVPEMRHLRHCLINISAKVSGALEIRSDTLPVS